MTWYRPEVMIWVNKRHSIDVLLFNLINGLSSISDRRIDIFYQIVVVMVTGSRIAYLLLLIFILAARYPISELLLVITYA